MQKHTISIFTVTTGSPPALRTQMKPPVSIPEHPESQHAQNVSTPTPDECPITGGSGGGKIVPHRCGDVDNHLVNIISSFLTIIILCHVYTCTCTKLRNNKCLIQLLLCTLYIMLYIGSTECLYLPHCVLQQTGTNLGHGSYGVVVEVSYKEKLFAAKIFRHVPLKDLLSVFSREQDILSRIRHPNIVSYYGVCQIAPDNTTVIVMERMATNLRDFLEDPKNVNTSLQIKFKILCDTAKGLLHLHKQKPAIIHRDLTATNVLLDSNHVAKISDFGNSRTVDFNATPELLTSNPGTLDYMPPEALEGGEYTDRLDVFSFGHLSLYVLIQHRPHPLLRPTYREHGRLIPRTEVERRRLFLDELKNKFDNHTFYQTLVNCLQDEPASRPSCADILDSNVFVESVNNS